MVPWCRANQGSCAAEYVQQGLLIPRVIVLLFRRVYITMSITPRIIRGVTGVCALSMHVRPREKAQGKAWSQFYRRMKSHMTSHHFSVTFVFVLLAI
jgi:hypothetical protein